MFLRKTAGGWPRGGNEGDSHPQAPCYEVSKQPESGGARREAASSDGLDLCSRLLTFQTTQTSNSNEMIK